MSKFVSVAVAVLLAVTGVIGSPHAPHTPTKPVPIRVHKLIAHHWSKTYSAVKITDCGPLVSCLIWIIPAFPGHPAATLPPPKVEYLGAPSTHQIDAMSHITIPATIANAVTAVANIRASVAIGGTKGHQFEMAACGDEACTFIQTPAVLKSSGVIHTSNVTLQPGSRQFAWVSGEIEDHSVADVTKFTVNITYYTLD